MPTSRHLACFGIQGYAERLVDDKKTKKKKERKLPAIKNYSQVPYAMILQLPYEYFQSTIKSSRRKHRGDSSTLKVGCMCTAVWYEYTPKYSSTTQQQYLRKSINQSNHETERLWYHRYSYTLTHFSAFRKLWSAGTLLLVATPTRAANITLYIIQGHEARHEARQTPCR